MGQCPMTVGFFDRLPQARDELMTMGVITDQSLDEVAWQHQLCPFELALQMLPWMQVVIADYNYVFDPLVRLPHFSESRSDTLLLIDEAHNLVDRSRSMYSAELSREACRQEAALCRSMHPLIAQALDNLSQQLLVHARTCDHDELVADQAPASVTRSATRVVESMLMAMGEGPGLSETGSELFRSLCRYVAISELFSEDHRCISRLSKQGQRRHVELSLFCLDAHLALSRQYRLFRSQVVFSATLRPAPFYRDTLGLPESTAWMQLDSPFEESRCLRAVIDWVDTRYRQREQSLSALVDLIHQVSHEYSGNYLVFFPSYAYLNMAYDAYVNQYPEEPVWKQTSDQSKDTQQQLLAAMDHNDPRIGFAILGGVFGEGIDYLGDRLIGVIIVSTGLPGLDIKTQLVSEHYARMGQNGYDFAYRYPGLTRVLQTVGRLVRSESDRGVVILVDDRFKQSFYRRLFPAGWHVRQPTDLARLQQDVKLFWTEFVR